MKNRINLYTQEMRPKLALFTLDFVGFVCGVALAIILLSYFWVTQRAEQLSQQYAQLNLQSDQLQLQLNQLSSRLASRKPDPQLTKQVQDLDDELQNKQRVLAGLSSITDMQSRNYPELMQELASIQQPELWLTHIQAENTKVRLEGGIQQAEILPAWLDKLAKTDFFRGQDFAQAQVYRDPDEQLRFVISSEPGSPNKGEVKR
ncbi:PilN domain-containing protein [Neptunicella sp. SCSIO 80796]|uniref:PilN domain-containing protein n=1 Tax=Neptunicella plasticusilytica TaxID=3117012 RepID=UPI003A4D9126